MKLFFSNSAIFLLTVTESKVFLFVANFAGTFVVVFARSGSAASATLLSKQWQVISHLVSQQLDSLCPRTEAVEALLQKKFRFSLLLTSVSLNDITASKV